MDWLSQINQRTWEYWAAIATVLTFVGAIIGLLWTKARSIRKRAQRRQGIKGASSTSLQQPVQPPRYYDRRQYNNNYNYISQPEVSESRSAAGVDAQPLPKTEASSLAEPTVGAEDKPEVVEVAPSFDQAGAAEGMIGDNVQPKSPSAPLVTELSNQVSSTFTADHPHLAPLAPATVDLSERLPSHIGSFAPEASPRSGKLAPQFLRQRERLRKALWNASYLVQELESYADKHAYVSRSDQPYQNNVRLHGALLEYLRATRKPVADLNNAMNALDGIDWLNGDPREVFFASLNPIGLGESSGEVRSAFRRALTSMVDTVKGMGYTVTWRAEPYDAEYPNRKWTWHLTKVRNLKLESFDVPDDELGGEEDKELDENP